MAYSEEIALLQKGDRNVVETTLRRGFGKHQGLIVTVRAVPQIEEFMKGLGNGETREVYPTLGRHWQPLTEDPLRIYDLQQAGNPGQMKADDGTTFRIDLPALPLITQEEADSDPRTIRTGPRERITNLSFLRLAGISEGGVTFKVQGVLSEEELARMRDRIAIATKRFYRNYIRPLQMDIQVIVSLQDFRPMPDLASLEMQPPRNVNASSIEGAGEGEESHASRPVE